MRWHSPSIESRLRDEMEWHRWFAWHPVRIGQDIVWLAMLERRRPPFIFSGSTIGPCDYFEYRLPHQSRELANPEWPTVKTADLPELMLGGWPESFAAYEKQQLARLAEDMKL